VNNWNGIGNLVDDVELRYTQSGKAIATGRIGVSRRFQKDKSDFIEIRVWGKSGENYFAKYGKKGKQLAVQGELNIDTWKDEQGNWKSRTYINAQEVKLLGGQAINEDTSTPDGFAPVDDMDSDIPF